jgi:hypothetical protein
MMPPNQDIIVLDGFGDAAVVDLARVSRSLLLASSFVSLFIAANDVGEAVAPMDLWCRKAHYVTMSEMLLWNACGCGIHLERQAWSCVASLLDFLRIVVVRGDAAAAAVISSLACAWAGERLASASASCFWLSGSCFLAMLLWLISLELVEVMIICVIGCEFCLNGADGVGEAVAPVDLWHREAHYVTMSEITLGSLRLWHASGATSLEPCGVTSRASWWYLVMLQPRLLVLLVLLLFCLVPGVRLGKRAACLGQCQRIPIIRLMFFWRCRNESRA